MGYGGYSQINRSVRSQKLGYNTKSLDELFNHGLDNGMNPKNISLRESRDSEEHPNSISIILGLDVTGSMGVIPHALVKEGLPKIMSRVIEAGIDDPQVLFLGVGDHKVDQAPLQVGQFESNDELLDKWLTSLFLEGGGGGNGGESYHLAWYFASLKTTLDSLEKRKQKGFLFTIGDEPVHNDLNKESINRIIGGEERDYSTVELLEMAREKYNVFHIHIPHGVRSSSENVINGWRELLGDNLIVADSKENIPKLIPSIISKNLGVVDTFVSTSKNNNELKEEIIL